MYKIVAVLAFPAITATILCTTIILYCISVYYFSIIKAITAAILCTIIICTISVNYFSIMVAEKGCVAERGHIQTF